MLATFGTTTDTVESCTINGYKLAKLATLHRNLRTTRHDTTRHDRPGRHGYFRGPAEGKNTCWPSTLNAAMAFCASSEVIQSISCIAPL